jgi:hypothetical protein
MQGGKKGLLENSTDICKAPQRVSVKAEGQNGRRANSNPPLQANCKGKAKKKQRHKRHARAEREGR